MTTPKDRYIFISHSSANRQVTEELYQALTGDPYRLTCWLDNKDIATSEKSFPEQIVDALQNAAIFVEVDTPQSRASDYVNREINLARQQKIPIYHCKIKESQHPFLRKLRIQQLAWSIQLRATRPLLMAALTLSLVLVLMAAIIFIVGTRIAPLVVNAYTRSLPDAKLSASAPSPTPVPLDPKIAAPFHFLPQYSILTDDFNNSSFDGSFNPSLYQYNIQPRDSLVKVGQQSGSLVLHFPNYCASEEKRWDCELQIDSNPMELSTIQYFGLRARLPENSPNWNVSVSISNSSPDRRRAGFGWSFTDHTMAFFRTIPALPEKEFYAYVNTDTNWHAFEILRDPNTSRFFYYVDGQLVDTYTLTRSEDWALAPLQLIIYSNLGQGTIVQKNDIIFEMDEVAIGGFSKP